MFQVKKVTNTADLGLAYHAHYDWYRMAGFIQENPSHIYVDEHTRSSDYFVVSNQDEQFDFNCTNEIIGVVRLIKTGPFPMLVNFELDTQYQYLYDNTDSYTEISALCWKPRTAKLVAPQLYRAIYQGALDLHVSVLLTSLDTELSRLILTLGIPLKQCGHSKMYMGSDTTPFIIDMAELRSSLPLANPRLWELINMPLDK